MADTLLGGTQGASMEIKEAGFDTGAVILNYAEVPSGSAPLVLLHGGNGRWQSFTSLLPGLAGRWHIYAPDLRGHGKSSRAPGHYRLHDYADDTIAFLRRHIREPACLFGHSLGGIVALLVAAQYPQGVRMLAVGDAPLSRQSWHAVIQQSQDRVRAWRDLSGGQKTLDEIVAILKDTPIEVPGRLEPVPMRAAMGEDAPVYAWLASNLYQSDPDLLTAILDRFDATAAGYEMSTVLPAIPCSVLLLQADPAAGGLMTDAEVAAALPHLARPSHVRLPGVSHALHHVHPEPVITALNTFFSE
jgi:pimeloyl-ACP methyl ester carboxylesterase